MAERQLAREGRTPQNQPTSLPRRVGPQLPPGLFRSVFTQRAVGITFFALLLAALVLRIVAMACIELVPEEAYYWMYSRNLSLSYFDHPPMVAWCIRLGTTLFGNTELGVRAVGSVLSLLSLPLLYLLGRQWFPGRAALLAATALATLPVYFGMGIVATMDAALIFFWLVCLLGVSLALRRQQPAGWLLAGVGLGGALLSKYTGVFLIAGVGLVLITRRPWRRHLLSPWPYLSLLLGVALFSPVLVWNYQHDWASFRFQFLNRFQNKAFAGSNVGVFLGFQVAVLTPTLLLGALTVGLWLLKSRRRLFTARWCFALAFSLPLLAVMAYKSLRYEIHLNWTAPAFVSLLPAMASCFLGWARRRGDSPPRWDWSFGVRWTAIACVAVNVVLLSLLFSPLARKHAPAALGPWRELALVVQDYEERLEKETGREPFIVADGKYRLASVLAFYRMALDDDADASQFTTSQWIFDRAGLGYAYWSARSDWTGRDCVYVNEGNDLDELRRHFNSVDIVSDVRMARLPRYEIALCRGLKAPPTVAGVVARDLP